MPIYAKATKTYEPMPAGNYPAICCMMVDLGSVPKAEKYRKSEGGEQLWHAVYIRWEFPDETKVFSEERGPEPYTINKTYTLSLGFKTDLRKHLEAWRGKAFTDQEAENFDITKLIGKPCLINVYHEEKDGSVSAKIASISPIPKGMTAPKPFNKPVLLSFDEWDESVYMSLPEWMRERIAESEEYKAMHGEAVAPPPPASDDDDLPF